MQMEHDIIFNQCCITGMKTLPDACIDLVLCDLPYGTTGNKWDAVIPFTDLWEQYNRITKPNAAIVLFSDEPFTCALIKSNLRNFRYKWIWNKERGSNFQNARRMPMKSHEEICVFYRKSPVYNPQYWFSTPFKTKERERRAEIEGLRGGSAANVCAATVSEDGRRYPLSILTFPRDGKRVHPTQKPVPLLEYLIKTYSNEGDIVLDNCFGSGSTLIAAANTGRHYIGFENDPQYFDIACDRLDEIENRGGGNSAWVIFISKAMYPLKTKIA